MPGLAVFVFVRSTSTYAMWADDQRESFRKVSRYSGLLFTLADAMIVPFGRLTAAVPYENFKSKPIFTPGESVLSHILPLNAHAPRSHRKNVRILIVSPMCRSVDHIWRQSRPHTRERGPHAAQEELQERHSIKDQTSGLSELITCMSFMSFDVSHSQMIVKTKD